MYVLWFRWFQEFRWVPLDDKHEICYCPWWNDIISHNILWNSLCKWYGTFMEKKRLQWCGLLFSSLYISLWDIYPSIRLLHYHMQAHGCVHFIITTIILKCYVILFISIIHFTMFKIECIFATLYSNFFFVQLNEIHLTQRNFGACALRAKVDHVVIVLLVIT